MEGYPSAGFEQFANEITCLPQDRVKDLVLLYGRLYEGKYIDLMDAEKVAEIKRLCRQIRKEGGIAILYGMGAACEELQEIIDVLIYLDVTPKEVMLRAHAGRWKNFDDDVAQPVKELQRRRIMWILSWQQR